MQSISLRKANAIAGRIFLRKIIKAYCGKIRLNFLYILSSGKGLLQFILHFLHFSCPRPSIRARIFKKNGLSLQTLCGHDHYIYICVNYLSEVVIWLWISWNTCSFRSTNTLNELHWLQRLTDFSCRIWQAQYGWDNQQWRFFNSGSIEEKFLYI